MKLGALYVIFLLALAVTACVTPPQASSGASGQAPIVKKQIVVAILGDPAGLHQEMTATSGNGTVPGLQETYQILDGALTHLDADEVRQPELAEAVPTVENGLWKVLPDGRMELTWHLKPGVTWQDGTPLTADDLRFTVDVYRDKEIGIGKPSNLAALDGIDVTDPQTAVMKWTKIYTDADQVFSGSKTMWLLPKHILEGPLQDNKEGFLGLPYWREGFVGAGAFAMREFASGSHMTLVANDSFVLGRPRLDELEVRFFTDRRTLLASILSGAVQTFIGHGLYPEDILTIQNSGQDVRV
ncbi:MAG TPA: ABC transporter substrate-binding protein, partial [Chloroflexota bacterium]